MAKGYTEAMRSFYEGDAKDQTERLEGELESIRLCLGLYPQVFEIVRNFLVGLPIDRKNSDRDAFIARETLKIMMGFAQRLHAVGLRDLEDPHWRLQYVDLSAADESKDVDDAAIEESARNQGGIDEPSTAHSDKDIEESAEVADDKAIRDSLGIEDIDDKISGADENEGGTGRIQLDMLDSEGTDADPVECAKIAARFLFEGVIYGHRIEATGIPGVVSRLQPLTKNGVLRKGEARARVASLHFRT